MKINPVSLVKQNKNVIRNAGFALLAGISMAACTPMPTNVKEAFKNKSKEEYDVFVTDCRKNRFNEGQVQAKLDSMAYRDLLNVSTKDGTIIKEFDEIAGKNVKNPSIHVVEENLIETLSEKEYRAILNDSYSFGHATFEYFTDPSKFRHKHDSAVFKKFFEEKGLLDETTNRYFKKVANATNPKQNFSLLIDRK